MKKRPHDVPSSINIEQDPTISWEPDTVESTPPDLSGRALGAFSWALTIQGGPQSGLTYVLESGVTTAGRGAECSIFLPDVTVSREHVRFSVDESGLSMTDLGSTNGTYVNRERLRSGSLSEGDELMVGKYHLKVSRGHG